MIKQIAAAAQVSNWSSRRKARNSLLSTLKNSGKIK
jgi:hypothetical protein